MTVMTCYVTVMCLSIGTPISNKFSICTKCKINYFRFPKIWAQCSQIIMCSNIGTPKIINFPFGTNGKLMVLGVPVFKPFRVFFPPYESWDMPKASYFLP